MYRLTLIIVLLVAALGATGQNNPARIDSVTWQHYIANDWDGVLSATRASLRDGIDFYYLRVRAGKATFEKKQYRLAVSHFAEAIRQNPNDDFVNYWHYQSLLMDGRSDEADAFFATLGREATQRLELDPRPAVSFVLAEAQYSASRDAATLQEAPLSPSDYLAYRGVYREQTYTGVGIDHRVNPTFHLFHGLSHLGIERTHLFQTTPDNQYLYEGKVSQVQYFLQGRFQLRKGWGLQASATLLGGYSDAAYYTETANGMAGILPDRYVIGDRQVSAAISRSGTWLEPALGFTLGSVGGFTQTQATSRLSVYPLRNANLVLTTQFDMHHDGGDDRWKPILQQHLTLKTGPVWWIAEAASGDIRNFTTLGGYVVYNQPETIKQIKGLSLYVPLFRYKLDLTLRYRLLDKEGTDFEYSDQNTFNTVPYNYNDDSFLISVRWHF